MLRFRVQGSAARPYRVSFEGSGADLRAFCTCPVSGLGGKFCKHAAALLMGDVTHLVGDSTDIAELKRRAEGSPLLDKAMVHPTPKPKPQRIVRGFHSLADVERVYAPALRERGMRVDLYDTEDGGSRLCIHVLGRHGKPLKAPRVVLAHMPFKDMEISAEVTLSLTDDGEVSTVYRRQEIIPKSKIPWRLNVNGTSRAWAHLDSAIPAFESALAEI